MPDNNKINLQLPPSSNDFVYLKDWERYRLSRVATGSTDPITRVNRFKLLTDKDEGYTTKSFIFVTRPDFNIYDDGGNLLDDIKSIPIFKYVSQLPVGEAILKSLSFSTTKSIIGNTPWLSVMTNYATSYNVPSERELEVTQVGKTYHDFSIQYGNSSFKHMVSGDITIDFRDNRDMVLYWTLRLWCEYIHHISYGMISPKRKYIYNAVLDYATALYYIVTDETMENIIYWEKLTGLFPVKSADQTWAWEQNSAAKQLNYSIDFKYSMRSVLDEFDLAEINNQYRVLDDNYKVTDIITSHVDKAFNQHATINSGALQDLIAWYNKSDISSISQEDMEKFYYSTIDTGSNSGVFLPNYIPELGIHGVPYVKGPFITKLNTSDASRRGKNVLRWV